MRLRVSSVFAAGLMACLGPTARAQLLDQIINPNVSGVYDFDDGTIAGQPYPQRFRNRVVVAPALTAAYEFSPGRTAVLVVRGLDANYTNRPAGSPVRDFTDGSVLAGRTVASARAGARSHCISNEREIPRSA